MVEPVGIHQTGVALVPGSAFGDDRFVRLSLAAPNAARTEERRDAPRTSRPSAGGGAVVAAAMLGLDQAIYGERPKVEVVAEAAEAGAGGGGKGASIATVAVSVASGVARPQPAAPASRQPASRLAGSTVTVAIAGSVVASATAVTGGVHQAAQAAR